MDGSGDSVRPWHLLELLDQCRQGISLLAEENEALRQELGLQDSSDAQQADELEEQPEVRRRSGPSNLSVPERSVSQRSLAVSPQRSLSQLGVSPIPTTLDGGMQVFTVAPLWKKAVSMQGSISTGDLTDVLALTADSETDMRRMNGPTSAAAALCSKFQLPLSPNSGPRLSWDMFGLLLICWDVFYIPLTVLDLQDAAVFTDFMDWLTLIFWTLDIFMSFTCGFYRKGELVMSWRSIALNYMMSWFLVDLIVVVPDWVTSVTSADQEISQNMKIIRAFRALRILRLLRLLKLQRLVNIVYDFISSEYAFIMIGMLRLVVFIVVLNHVIACVWFFTGRTAIDTGLPRSWLTDTDNGDLLQETQLYQYLTSLHWSLTQFTPASMEVSARNVPERVLSIAVLFFALITFSSFVGSITTSMTALRSMRADTKKQFWLLRRYLQAKKIPYTTRSRIIKFLEFQSAKKSAEVSIENVEILDLLSIPLRNLLQYELNKPCLEEHPFFAYLQEHMRPVMIRLCSRVLKFTAFAPEDVVFRPGEEATSMYIVQSGEMEYHTKTSGNSFASQKVGAGTYLTEAALWTSWGHRGYLTCRAASSIGLIKPGPFAEIAKVHTIPWNFCKHYAAVFVDSMNRQSSMQLNDLALSHVELQDLVSRATDPESLFDGHSPSKDYVRNSEQDTLDAPSELSSPGNAKVGPKPLFAPHRLEANAAKPVVITPSQESFEI